MMLLSKSYKKTWNPLIFKTCKMAYFHVSEISNALHFENLEYLHTLNTKWSLDIFHNRFIEILDQVRPDFLVRILAKSKMKDPWVTIGLQKSAEKNYLNFIKKSTGYENVSHNIRRYTGYRNMYDWLKRISKITYYQQKSVYKDNV